MSTICVIFGFWVAGIISGVLLGAQDRKNSPQSTVGLLIIPLITVAVFFLCIALVLEIAPRISLEATAEAIVETFIK